MLRGATLALLLCLTGCANPWRDAFAPARPGAPTLERLAGPAIVREAPWERVGPALERARAAIAADPQHPDDWPIEKRRAFDAPLLEALRVNAADFDIVGRSRFTSTTPLDPADGSLARAAAQRGAVMAVWSSRFLGRTERLVSEPVHSYTSGTLSRRDRDGKRRTETYSETTTTYVPVKVQADEREYIAFFLAPR
ncbi:MAG: hypothetical protein FJ255_05265 [Phycisphaerae bacterium]|nr:hypothetical protein [Phycisphaerae bacterium]